MSRYSWWVYQTNTEQMVKSIDAQVRWNSIKMMFYRLDHEAWKREQAEISDLMKRP